MPPLLLEMGGVVVKIVIDARGGYENWWPLGRRLLPVHFYRFSGGPLFSRTLKLALSLGELECVLVDEENKFLAMEELEKASVEDPERFLKFEEDFDGEYLVMNPRILLYSDKVIESIRKTSENSAFFYKASVCKPLALHWNPSTGEYITPKNCTESMKLLKKGFLVYSGIYYGPYGTPLEDLQACEVEGIEVFWSLVDVAFLESKEEVELRRSERISVYSERPVILSGVEDLVVLDLEDLTFISSKDGVVGLDELYKKVKNLGSEKSDVHRTAFRPWGSYTVLEEKEGFKVKRITVYPKKRLSLQLHYHRSEHWTVVKGTAKVTVGEKTILMKPGDHVFIPTGEVHRLENPGMIPLEVIEVQVGEYLGEDDIVRIEDDFKRA